MRNFWFTLYICGHELNGTLQAVIGVRGTDETYMGLARLIHDLHPGASAPPIQTIPDLKIGARSLSGMIYVQKETAIHLLEYITVSFTHKNVDNHNVS